MARSRALHDFEMTLLSRVVERRLALRVLQVLISTRIANEVPVKGQAQQGSAAHHAHAHTDQSASPSRCRLIAVKLDGVRYDFEVPPQLRGEFMELSEQCPTDTAEC